MIHLLNKQHQHTCQFISPASVLATFLRPYGLPFILQIHPRFPRFIPEMLIFGIRHFREFLRFMSSEVAQEIFEYSRRGLLDDLHSVIQEDHPDAFVAYDGSTAFLMACKQGHLSVCKLLIQHGANPKLRTEDGSTSLLLAAATGSVDLVEFLLALCHADINECNEDGFTPLDIAKYYNHTTVVSLLESRGGQSSGAATPDQEEFSAGPSEKWGYGVFDM